MTELETILTQSLEKLSNQYAEDMKQLQQQVTTLTKQVIILNNQYQEVKILLKEELEK